MGNCQAVDTASLVIQHPSGKSEKLFWPIPATQVMKSNPGHYVALLITTTTTTTTGGGDGVRGADENTVRITRVKLLRPTDTLTLGHVYRLIRTQEVMKGLMAKKQAKMMKMKQGDCISEKSIEKALKHKVESGLAAADASVAGSKIRSASVRPQPENSSKGSFQMSKHETQRVRTTSSASAASRSKAVAWQPSLKSISESQS